jgi:hypothetical protein
LQGVIKRIDTVDMDDGPRKVMHIERAGEDGEPERVAVWESAGLRALFECNIGQEVYISFQGMGQPKKKGHSPPRLFEVGVLENEKPM